METCFPEFFHTMEVGFGHFATQWKPVSPAFSTPWKTLRFRPPNFFSANRVFFCHLRF
jgi:hypothetical protein